MAGGGGVGVWDWVWGVNCVYGGDRCAWGRELGGEEGGVGVSGDGYEWQEESC